MEAYLIVLLVSIWAADGQKTYPMSGQGINSAAQYGTTNRDWWPTSVNLKILHLHSNKASPMDAALSYKKEFLKLYLAAVKADLLEVMKDSKPRWPADYGHYGPLLIRMAWHIAGTYRVGDGRSGGGTGNQRLVPLNSWHDNANLD